MRCPFANIWNLPNPYNSATLTAASNFGVGVLLYVCVLSKKEKKEKKKQSHKKDVIGK